MDEIDTLYIELTQALHTLPHGEPDQAFIRRYLGTPRSVLAARTPALRRLAAGTVKERQEWPASSWLALLDRLYAGELFEQRALAGFVLHSLPHVRRPLDLDRLAGWLSGQVGWAEVDTTCQSGWQADELLDRWMEWQPFLERLTMSEIIGLRRASLVLFVSPLRASADERLTRQALAAVERLAPERDPLITKAVSWVLRTLTLLQPELVRATLEAHAADLPPIAVRETRRKLETGRKSVPVPPRQRT